MGTSKVERDSTPRAVRSTPAEALEPTRWLRPAAPPAEPTPAELAEAVGAQQRARWQQGDRVPVEEFFLQHPALRDCPETFPLIYNEFLLREELGEAPSLAEYQNRFPHHATQLEQQIRLHRLLGSAVARPAGPAAADPQAHPATLPREERPQPAEEKKEAHPVTLDRPEPAPAGQPSWNWPTIDGYEILGELGRGGMGVVYKARQLGLNRLVALKMVLGGPFAEAGSRNRFLAEAEAVAKLQHPNIVQVFAVGTRESPLGDGFSCPYFSQEYVAGGNLAERLDGTPQSPPTAARFVQTLADAIHYAHEQGIVHRDLKPSNILLVSGGVERGEWCTRDRSSRAVQYTPLTPKIADFGLAKQFDRNQMTTASGAVLGTPEYMAPEQADGKTAVGPAADIYSLGVILYEMITGRRPLEGPTLTETLDLVRHQEPVPPRRLQPRIPRDLETICLKCLQKEPHRRYASARELGEDLGRFLAREPIRARPVGWPERAWRWARRRPDVAALTAVALLLAVGGVAGITAAWLHALAGWHEAGRLGRQADLKRAEAEDHWHRAEREQAEAENNLYFSRVAQIQLETRLNNFAAAERLLELCRPTSPDAADRRGWEWHYLRGLLQAHVLTLPAAHAEFVSEVAFSPDGKRLLTAGGSPFRPFPPDRVCVWEMWGADAGKCVREFPHPRMVRAAAFVADGRRVAWSGTDGGVALADVATGEVLARHHLPDGYHPAVFSPDGTRYASIDRTGRAAVWDLESGREILAVLGKKGPVHSLAFSPDGRRLAVSSPDALRLWDVTEGKVLVTFAQSKGGRGRPVFSPDGRRLAQGTTTGLARIWDVETGRPVQSMAGHFGGVLAVAFRPDGEVLATAGADHTVRLWRADTGQETLLLRGHRGRAACLSFHPSGHYLASGGEQPADVTLWDLGRHQEYVTVSPLPPTGGQVEAIGFADGGATLYTLRSNGQFRSSDAATGAPREFGRLDYVGTWRVPTHRAAFRADGRRLATVGRGDPKTVLVMDLPGGQVVHRLGHAHEVLQVIYSRDGSRLATSALSPDDGGRREIRVWDAETGKQLFRQSCDPFWPGRRYGAVGLSADGRLLAHDEPGPAPAKGAKQTYRVRIRDAAAGEVRQTFDGLGGFVEKLAFSPDGSRLAVTTEEEGVFLYDLPAGRRVQPTALSGSAADWFTDAAFNPDGRRLAAVGRAQVLIWDAATGQPVLALRGAPPRPSDNGFNPRLAWAPDGRRLAASNWDVSVSVWDSADWDGTRRPEPGPPEPGP